MLATEFHHGARIKFVLCVSVSLWWVLIGALGCARKAPQVALPQQAGDWAKQGETRAYTADNLYEYIDGGAEKYVQAGVQRALTADYRWQGKVDAVADVFVMGDKSGAQAVFGRETRCFSIQLGEMSCLYGGGTLKFQKGVYFVQVVAYDPKLREELVELGKAIERNLP